jgi:hypothetical protein
MNKRKTPEKDPQDREDDRDDDNPKWTEEDFANAKYGDDMPDFVKETFKVWRPAKGS